MLLLWLTCYLFLSCAISTNAFCPDDDDLQRHRCTCSLSNSYIQCSSLPEQCRTCYQYDRLFFDEHVQSLPSEAFRFYEFFSSTKKRSFTLQFAQLNLLSTSTFSKIDIDQNQTLEIKIAKMTSPLIPTRLFEDLTIQSQGTIDIEIFNITSPLFTIEQYAFDGIKFSYQSRFRLMILSARDKIEFQSNAGSILLPSYATMELYFSNFQQVLFDEHSFDHITQEHSSQLRIQFDRFDQAFVGHRSFIDLHQLDQSQFHLMFANFHRLIIEKTLFDTITQLKSSITFSIFNLSTDLCLPAEAFSQIQQDMNSTFQFQVQYGKNVLFPSNAMMNVSQRAQSKFSIVMINTNDVYFDQNAINYFHQEDRSLLDIWIKSGHHLIFEENSIRNIDIWRSSLMRIGFQYSTGKLQMSSNAFNHINEGQGGELLFQIMNSSDFNFRFNQSMKLERLEILDRIIIDEDFCRIIQIPSHIPVKLLTDQMCSCSVFYLYRHLHHTMNPTLLKEVTPRCYLNLSFDQIESEQNRCSFDQRVRQCDRMGKQVDLRIPNGLCYHRTIRLANASYHSSILAISALIAILALIYLLSTPKRRSIVWAFCQKYSFYPRRQKLPIFSADSYQQLTQLPETNFDENEHPTKQQLASRTMKILVKYNSTTEQTQPYLHQHHSSDFLVTEDSDSPLNEDLTLRLNTNPLSDMEINQS